MSGIVIAAGAALLVGAALGILLSLRTINVLRRRVRALQEGQGEARRKRETMKVVVWACVLNGFAWVWCSYILAALDKPQIAESLSQVALAEIIVPVAVYAGKSAVENLSKNNHWPDKPAVPDQDSGTDETPEDPDPPGVG